MKTFPWRRAMSIGSVALLPAVAIAILGRILFNASIFDAGFSSLGIWNDEIYYWHQIATFSKHGFSGGYYTFDEVSSSSVSRFGAHGPVYPLLFGSLGRIFGWHYYSAAMFHLVLVTLSIAGFAYFANVRRRYMVVLGVLYVTFWPLMFFTPTLMEEGLHYVIAAAFAVMFYRVGATEGVLSRRARFGWIFLFILASLLRPTWSFLLVPFLVYTGRKSARGIAISLASAGFGVLAAFGMFSYLTAPYPYGFVEFLRGTRGLGEQVRLMAKHAASNVEAILSPDNSLLMTNLQRLQHAQVAALLLAFSVFGIVAVVRRLRAAGRDRDLSLRTTRLSNFPFLVHSANLGLVAAMLIIMYDIGSWRDYRTLAPHLLLTLLLLVAMAPRSRFGTALVIVVVVSNVGFAHAYLADYGTYRASTFSGAPARVSEFRSAVAGFLRYDPNAEPWCNTLLSSWPNGEALPQEILGVPAGIGVSLDYSGGVQAPLRSGYVLTSPENAKRLEFETDLEVLTETPHGTLYFNRDSGCERHIDSR